MPELPEVETIKNDLGPQIVGKRIGSIELLWEGMVKDPSPDEFRAARCWPAYHLPGSARQVSSYEAGER